MLRGAVWEDIFLALFCKSFVLVFPLHASPSVFSHEGSRALVHHRCPGFGLTYPMQSVLFMQPQASGLNWDVIHHLTSLAT